MNPSSPFLKTPFSKTLMRVMFKIGLRKFTSISTSTKIKEAKYVAQNKPQDVPLNLKLDYECFGCLKESSCKFCKECFKAEKHIGHQFIFHSSQDVITGAV